MIPILTIPISSPVSSGQQILQNDLEIDGNLFVNGYLTALSGSILVDLQTADHKILLNTPCSGAGIGGDGEAGIEIDRGSLERTAILFDEATDAWMVKFATSADQTICVRSSAISEGAIPFGNNINGYTHDDAKLHWDNTNKRLGIGNNTPVNPLDVTGIVSFSKEVLVGKTNAEGYLVDIKGTATIPASVLRLDGYGATNSTSSMLMRSRDGSGTIKENTITCSSANGGTFTIKDNTLTGRIAFNPNRLYLDFKKTGDQSLMDLYDSTLVSGEYVRRRLGSGNSGGGSGASLTETFYYSTTPANSRGTLFIEGYESTGLQINSLGIGVGSAPTAPLDITIGANTNYKITTVGTIDGGGAGGSVGHNYKAKTRDGFVVYGGMLLAGVDDDTNYANLHLSASTALVKSTTGAPTGSQLMIKGLNGYVGIGNTSPETKLHIKSTGTCAVKIETSDDQYAITQYKTSTSSLWQTLVSPTNDYRIGIGSVGDFLTVTSTKKVGVGTTLPSTKLHISEDTAATNCTVLVDALDNNSLARLGFARAGTEQGAIEYKVDTTAATQELRFKTDNTTRMTIEGDGEVGIGVAPAAGYKLNVSGYTKTDGIAFPASQVASADANTLDDYEENTFVPSLAFLSGQSGSFTYSAQTGSYTKIGREVFCNINIIYSAKPSAGTQLEIRGLPFTCGESTTTGGIVEWSTSGSWTTSSPTVGYIGASGTKIILGRSSTTDTATYNQADIPSLAEFYLRFSYRV